MRLALSCGFCLWAACALPAQAIQVDGHIDPAEWQGARHVTDFRKTQPLSLEPASQPTEAWILATPEGLAIAFRNRQSEAAPRTRQKVQRDFGDPVDRVNLMIDFDGGSGTAYNFTVASTNGIADAVITNEFQFNDDWDGNWQHAVSEDAEGWSVEMRIPWYIAPMRESQGDRRTVKIYLDRVIGSTGERVAWPTASFERPRFVSDFETMEIPAFSQSLLAITPYLSGLHDLIRSDSHFDAGADVFWKPNGQFQLTATLNPDFGQVESDDLVVNFDATEIFISDKRPFFTENQGLFEYTTPSDSSQLLYTRRIGGPADDRQGAGDITAAAKVNGSMGQTRYGVFLAEEADSVGRSFGALRLMHDLETQNLGMMLTQVDRPFLDREATVLGFDHNWRPTPAWSVQTRIFGSRIDQADTRRSDLGATVWADYEMQNGWRQQWIAMHFGNDLEINDAGFLSRNSLNYLHWELRRRFTDLPDSSRYASKQWRGRVTRNHNNRGEKLNDQFRLSREGQLRNGSHEYAQININSAGVDDRLTRGNGSVRKPASFNAHYEYETRRRGAMSHYMELETYSGGLAGNEKLGFGAEYFATWFLTDAFRIHAGLSADHHPDWLVWQEDNLIGSYARRRLDFNAGLDWSIDPRQELRVKLQAIALDADLNQAYRVDAGGHAIATQDPVEDFNVRNFGLQIRYRYELAPLSHLYVVYGRGGFEDAQRSEDPLDLLRDSFSLRNDEQVLVKFSYRFEL